MPTQRCQMLKFQSYEPLYESRPETSPGIRQVYG